MRRWRVLGIIAAVALLTAPGAVGDFDPEGLYLTWQQDPLTTMTIDWNTTEERDSVVEYRLLGEETPWNTIEGDSFPFPFSERTAHRIELTGLDPGTAYEFRFGEDSRIFRFRTMPENLDEPLHIAIGGDTRHNQAWMEATNAQAVRQGADFIVWGGDLAYADGLEQNLYRWYEWFDAIKNTLVSDEGWVVPVVSGIGNHEVVDHWYTNHDGYEQTDAWRAQIAPYFYALFAFPGQPGYDVLDFGDYLSIIMMDTNHSNPIVGEQTVWLEGVLEDRQHVANVFPVYHVPAYPGHRPFNDSTSQQVRTHWAPLFEQYGIRWAFENHDHVYKRTYPILNGQVNEDGVVYIGDGAWGVEPRSGHNVAQTWYLRERLSVHHFALVTLREDHQQITVYDSQGTIIDSDPELPQVPDVLDGQESATVEEAEAAILDAGFTIGNPIPQYSDTVAEGLVMGQSPAPGTFLEAGSEIHLIVSQGTFTGDRFYVVPEGAGGMDGSSWDDAFSEAQLQDALDYAGSASIPIWLAGGEYNTGATLLWPSNAAAYGGFAVGDMEFDQRDITGTPTVVTGDGERRVIQTEEGATHIRIDGLTIVDGIADNGGGIYVLGLDDTTVIANSRFQNCRAIVSDGGAAIAVGGGSDGVIIENCVFYQNIGPEHNVKGALAVMRGFTNSATIRNSVFEENISGRGSGIGVRESTGTTIERCQFINNTTSSHGGGGLYIRDSSVMVTDSLFMGNEVLGSGGAIHIAGGNDDASTLVNCVFWDNMADGDGGAMWNSAGSTDNRIVVVNSTFANNTSSRGGGIYNSEGNGGRMTIANSIFWGNSISGTDGPQIRGTSSGTATTYSIVEGGYSGDGNISDDPLFVDAATGDLRLQSNSPAIGAGDPSIAPDGDIIGIPRPQGSGVDMGAYEFTEGEVVTVPDLVVEGWTVEDVEAALADAALILGGVTQAYSTSVPEGGVISQTPAAGSKILEGSAVSITVSRGPAPDLPEEMSLNWIVALVALLAVIGLVWRGKSGNQRANSR